MKQYKKFNAGGKYKNSTEQAGRNSGLHQRCFLRKSSCLRRKAGDICLPYGLRLIRRKNVS
ncbi:MAG: hypothetical protein A2X34_05235 [Elusimicrobia bacterium GWC2_51_8]|nr:MAG: hypothetical protein A2X34_05235 [Elusimicrobia bacterium GWC2_51_8]OGR88191.1 MAG: hypothetical protein A2021_01105 [Elusimicrobia bacterium GWF2_52_66]HAF95395.1 hypothetical protein [Elusimicrobiota bacterium]HCD38046.1 hypothetical protein [Candidatus Omnitrophota bacterium]